MSQKPQNDHQHDRDHDHAHDHDHDHGDDGHVHGPGCSHHAPMQPFVRATAKVGRNDPCPCGSEQKFKKCCGKAS